MPRSPTHESPPVTSTPGQSAAHPLSWALDANESAKDKVEQSASELFVINAVLKQEVPSEAQVGDVAEALKKTDLLEVKITEAAQELADVNQVLTSEIDQRVALERELAATRVELAKAKSDDN